MTKQEKELLNKIDGAYNLKRLDEMGKLQNKLVNIVGKASLPPQDILTILVVIQRQVEDIFLRRLVPVQKKVGGAFIGTKDTLEKTQKPVLVETEEGIGIEVEDGRNMEETIS